MDRFWPVPATTSIRLWSVDRGTTLKTLPGHTSWVWAVVFSPDGQTLASGEDRTIDCGRKTGICRKPCKGIRLGHHSASVPMVKRLPVVVRDAQCGCGACRTERASNCCKVTAVWKLPEGRLPTIQLVKPSRVGADRSARLWMSKVAPASKRFRANQGSFSQL